MQAFLCTHLLPARELLDAVRGGNRRRAAPQVAVDGPVRIPLGGTAEVAIKAGRAPVLEAVKLELQHPPAGVTLQEVRRHSDGLSLVIKTAI